jgi:DNA-binding beta-propeller fold protein YncE
MTKTMQHRKVLLGAVVSVSALALIGGLALWQAPATAQQTMVEIPQFEVDPLWPKPIPNEGLLGMSIGVSVDDQDNIWITHRSSATLHNNEKGAELNPPVSISGRGAKHVLAFSQDGELVREWGGPGQGYEWPGGMHGIFVDNKGFVWLGGNGAKDSHILKFTKDGKFIMQSGHMGKNEGSLDPVNFGRVAQIHVDTKVNEAYVADGYKNRRIAVVDTETGKIKRFWGAYGNKPNDDPHGPYVPGAKPLQQFRSPVHCVQLANDGLLYVCDRQHDRVQIFRTDGTFVGEHFFATKTLASGSTWEIAFSPDPKQRFIYMTDGQNNRVRIVERDTMKELATFGRGGRQPSEFYGVHSIATDSKGNIYTTETWEGKRLQKFIFRGMTKVPQGSDLGVLWPRRSS